MKRIRSILILLIVIFLSSCAQNVNPGNYPKEPDGPEPEAHNGVFVSEYGVMTFNGDGKSITIDIQTDLARLFELEEGEYIGTYVFLSGLLPPNGSFPIRYDAAHELEIKLDDHGKEYDRVFTVGIAADDGSSGSVGLNVVTEDKIPLLFVEEGHYFNVTFEKE